MLSNFFQILIIYGNNCIFFNVINEYLKLNNAFTQQKDKKGKKVRKWIKNIFLNYKIVLK